MLSRPRCTVLNVSVTTCLEDLAVSAESAEKLAGLSVSAGSVVWLEGDLPNWGEVVTCVSRGNEVRVFEPEETAWRAEEVRGVLSKLHVGAATGVAQIVLLSCETLTPANWDRLLKSFEEVWCVVWVCTTPNAVVPDTVRGRVSEHVEVAGGFDVAAAAELFGGEREALRLLEGAHGLNLLMSNAIRKGMREDLQTVANASGALFTSPVAAAEFLSAFGRLCTGSTSFDSLWEWGKQSSDGKRLVRTELLRWLAVDGVAVTDGSSALTSREVAERYEETARLLRRNVSPLLAISACVKP